MDLSALVKNHATDLLRAALGFGVPPADAEDVVQSVFAAYLSAPGKFEGRSSLKTYLFGILYNKAREAGRLRGRELATDPGDAIFEGGFASGGHWLPGMPKGPDDEAASAELAVQLAECLEGLPAEQRAAFLLKEVEREPSSAVCNVLGVSATHLRVLLFRARVKLRSCLEVKWR